MLWLTFFVCRCKASQSKNLTRLRSEVLRQKNFLAVMHMHIAYSVNGKLLFLA